MLKAITILILTLTSVNTMAAEVECTDKPECWPEGSSMQVGLQTVQNLKELDKTLEKRHKDLITLLETTPIPEGQLRMDGRMISAVKQQHAAWVKFRDPECELVGSLTGAGGTWPSTYSNLCELNISQSRLDRVNETIRCIEATPEKTRWIDREQCLKQLTPIGFVRTNEN